MRNGDILNKLLTTALVGSLLVTPAAGCGAGSGASGSGAGDIAQGKEKAAKTEVEGNVVGDTKSDDTEATEGSSETDTDDNVEGAGDTGDKSDATDTNAGDNEDGTGTNADDNDESTDTDAENASDSFAASSLSEEDLSSPIEFSYQCHPESLIDDGKELATCIYYTITLDKSEEEKFPKLKEVLDEFGTNGEARMGEFFTKNTDDIRGMFDNGWSVPYEYRRDLYPIRSDGRVFSFVVCNYTFLAGAHGFTDFSNYNYDPVTGKEIKFADVFKSTDDLPEIIVSDLEKQNEDIAKYFDGNSYDRDNLVGGIPSRLEEDARGLCWAIDYDGVWIYFEDYAMGTYAAGAQSVKLSFFEHPELFTDTYINYEKDNIPLITDAAKELKEADNTEITAAPRSYPGGLDDDGRGPDEAYEEEGDGEDWWYHAVVTNPGWTAWTADGIDTAVGTPSVTLKEISHTTTDWLNEEKWSKEKNIPLPETAPAYEDDTFSYSISNNAEGGILCLTVMNKETQTLNGNYYFDEFISPPDQGTGLFADYTEPYIFYALMDGDTLFVALGHMTYASANPHKAYIVAIDTVSGNTLWKSDDQVAGACNFIIEGDSIICGYGFTDEPDYIYILNKNNGKTQKQIKVKSAPSYFIRQDGQLYVLTYNTEYLYSIK